MSTSCGQHGLALLAVLLLALSWGCLDNLPGKPDRTNRPVLPAHETNFEVLFARNCSGCHGADGKFGPAPPLNDPLLLAIIPDEVLIDMITHGRPGTPMPAFAQAESGSLTNEQIAILAKGLKSHWQAKEMPPQDLPEYATQVSASPSAESVARGEKLFAQACAGCHKSGDDGDTPPGRLNNRSLLSLLSNQVLRRIIITGRPDLGMPSYQDKRGRDDNYQPLSSEQIDDLVALLAHWRGHPDADAVANSSHDRTSPESLHARHD
jgi:cytochrome c oxidase cbb3-type subunit 3